MVVIVRRSRESRSRENRRVYTATVSVSGRSLKNRFFTLTTLVGRTYKSARRRGNDTKR
jgi:hypothetical protein